MHWRLAALTALLACAAVATAQPTPVTLYAHLINVQDFPLNTQVPAATYQEDAGFGMGAMQLTCLHSAFAGATGGTTSQEFYTYYGYTTPSLVEYGIHAADGSPRTHPTRGVAADVRVNTSVPMELLWYLSMSTQANPGAMLPDDRQPVPLPIPNVVIRATLRGGDGISINNAAYNAGPLLARGSTEPVTLIADQVVASSPSGQVKALGLVDNRWVYEFRVPLQVDVPVLSKSDGANLRVDTYLDNPQCDPDAGSIQTLVLQHSSANHRPRLEFAVDNPFAIVSTGAQWVNQDLVLTFEASSVWGAYDLDETALRLDVRGPDPGKFQRVELPTYHHHPHSDPIPQLVWKWANATREAPSGHYDVTLNVPNRQGTAVMAATVSFDKEPASGAPGASGLLLALALVGAAVLRRR